jgi:hypothetical protein
MREGRGFVALLGGWLLPDRLLPSRKDRRIYRLGCLFAARRSEPYHLVFFCRATALSKAKISWSMIMFMDCPVERYATAGSFWRSLRN